VQNIFRTHGIKETRRSETEVDLCVEEIENLGYCIIDSGLSETELRDVRQRIDDVYAAQLKELGGESQLERINDAKVARCLIGYDDFFLRLAVHEKMQGVLKRMLGDYFILMSQNGIINQPTGVHYQITWHRDLNYQHFVSSRPVAMSALYCVDNFSEETGGTHVLPASHKVEAFPSKAYVEKHQRVVEAKAGSIIIFDAMLFHRSGLNRSGRTRRAVNHIFTLPFIKQQIDLPKTLNGKFSEDAFLRRLLGYESEPGETAYQWRQMKLSKLPGGCLGQLGRTG
jgi:ectoine hydroxylase-related dioxygenase (phytanoyl-CoA dioxygenase family)